MVAFSTASVYQILRFSRKWEIWWRKRESDLSRFSCVLRIKHMSDAEQDGWNSMAPLHPDVSGWVRVSAKIKENCLLALYPLCFFAMSS